MLSTGGEGVSITRFKLTTALIEKMTIAAVTDTGIALQAYSHHQGDPQGKNDTAALQRPPNDLGLLRGVVVCIHTKQNTYKNI